MLHLSDKARRFLAYLQTCLQQKKTLKRIGYKRLGRHCLHPLPEGGYAIKVLTHANMPVPIVF